MRLGTLLPKRVTALPTAVKLLAAASLLNDIASEIIFPLMPLYVLGTLGGNPIWVGLIDGVADAVGSILKLWAGAWSDRAGRRRRGVVAGYGLAAIARPLIGLAGAPWHALSLRLIDRVGKGIRTAPRDALIAEAVPSSERGWAFGFHRGMDHLGAAIGPLLAGGFLWMWPDRLRTLFLLTALPGAAVVALLAWKLREPEEQLPAAAPPRLSLTHFDRSFAQYLLALVVFALGNSTDAFLLLRASDLGTPVAGLPMLWLWLHICKSSGNVLLGSMVDRWSAKKLIYLGWAVYGLGYLGFGLAGRAWHMWPLFAAYALFYALTEPAEKALTVELAGDGPKGQAFGWFHLMNGVMSLPASLVFGVLYKSLGPLVAFSTGATLAAAAALILAKVHTPRRAAVG